MKVFEVVQIGVRKGTIRHQHEVTDGYIYLTTERGFDGRDFGLNLQDDAAGSLTFFPVFGLT